ncbi:MAG: TonB-dependent receptor [Muribaculaceae bacterium]|nr:TonB-dependent receptor [Muribaculaceae bacterium]
MKKFLLSSLVLLMATLTIKAEDILVQGTVISAQDGEPLIGATVMSLETKKGTATDIDGNFELSVPSGTKIRVSYVGYQDFEGVAMPQMDIKLSENSEVLDEVVVVGYSTQKKADVTGAISTVSASDLAKQNENNPMKALQGRVPGMNISADGNPSGSATVRIRGVGTLNNNDPLYVIDGVPTKSGLHELNPGDIESMQILKDAASASIYGSRAANGVIIITTKKGNDLKVTLDASVAAEFYNHRLKVLNSEQYGRALWQAAVNDGNDPNNNSRGFSYNWGYDASGYPVLYSVGMKKYLDQAQTLQAGDTDWVDETTRTGFVQNYNFSVSGSTDKISSYFSLGYYKNLGVIKDTDFERFSARINTEYKPFNKVLTIGEHFTVNHTDEVASPGDFLRSALEFYPTVPVYDSLGEFAGAPEGYDQTHQNPVAQLYRNKNNRYKFWRMFGDAYINVVPFTGLNIRTTFGLDYSQKQQRNFRLPESENGATINAVTMIQEHWTKWMWNLVANYNVEFGYEKRNHIDALAGMELIRENTDWFSGYKEDFAILNPDYMWPDAGVGSSLVTGRGEGYSLASFFAKINYSYDSRYLLGLTLRYDGSSRFGPNNRWATFPSVSLGWRINQEKFMHDITWISDLKLRASWGQTGNQEINNLARYYIFVPNYGNFSSGGQTYGTSYDIDGTNGGSLLPSGFKRQQIGNPDIKWETTTQYNLGLDFSFLNSRLFGNFDIYYKKTSDILVNMVGIAAMGEGSSQWINAGDVENKGLELTLGFRNTTSYGFTYEVTGNISSYRNKITYMPATVAATGQFGGDGQFSVIGHPIYSQAGYVADGIFKSQDEVNNHAIQEGAGVGRIRWRDLDGNGIINEKDRTWIYDPTPDFTYGLNVYLQYRDFDFTMFWQGSQGNDALVLDMKSNTDLWSATTVGGFNKGNRVLDAWTPQNPNSTIPALSNSDTNHEHAMSTYFVENGSFLKLRNIQFGYVLPSKLTEKIRISRLRFYVSAQNLLTIHSKSFTGLDPENPNFGYPISTNLTFGLNLTF